MEIIRSVSEMQRRALALKSAGENIGFVPTMGYLHRGHRSLMRIAHERSAPVVVSIFVNPTQFGANEDLDAYPRDFGRDEQICRAEGVDILFYPADDEMYRGDSSVFVVEERLAQGLCGRSRPDHFRGVCTVVAKLFNIVQPAIAVFGEKDYQQLCVLRRMTRDLNFPVEVVSGPIVREKDGLAISSRNKYLSQEERRQALCLRQALDAAEEVYAGGERDAAVLRDAVRREIDVAPLAKIDYIELVDAENLESVDRIRRPALLALAVYIGVTRLIDNTVVGRL